MSSNATGWQTVHPERAYTRLRRVIHAFAFIKAMAALGPDSLERTKSKHVGPTYGVEPDLIKKIKARFRNELSFGGDGK